MRCLRDMPRSQGPDQDHACLSRPRLHGRTFYCHVYEVTPGSQAGFHRYYPSSIKNPILLQVNGQLSNSRAQKQSLQMNRSLGSFEKSTHERMAQKIPFSLDQFADHQNPQIIVFKDSTSKLNSSSTAVKASEKQIKKGKKNNKENIAMVPKVKIDGKSLRGLQQKQAPPLKRQIVNLSEEEENVKDKHSKNLPKDLVSQVLHLEHFDTGDDNSSCPVHNLNEDSDEDISLTSMENTRNRQLLQEAISLQHQLNELSRVKSLRYYQEYSHQQELSKPRENMGDSNSQEDSFDEEYKTGEVTIENPPNITQTPCTFGITHLIIHNLFNIYYNKQSTKQKPMINKYQAYSNKQAGNTSGQHVFMNISNIRETEQEDEFSGVGAANSRSMLESQ